MRPSPKNQTQLPSLLLCLLDDIYIPAKGEMVRAWDSGIYGHPAGGVGSQWRGPMAEAVWLSASSASYSCSRPTL